MRGDRRITSLMERAGSVGHAERRVDKTSEGE
jgi:hypothetical protein